MHTVNALRALGIEIEQPEPTELIVHGKKRVLSAASGDIDCGNSGTAMRLLAGLLAGQNFESRLVGDASLSRRPMDRIITPLRKMGANIVAEGPEHTPPLRINGGSLKGIHYSSPIASAQVKGSLLLAGLFAKGKTTVDEPSTSRNHTELIFNYFLLRTARGKNGAVSVFGDQMPESRDFNIPGDLSSAAFWLTAAAAQPGGHLLVRNVGLNDTRTAILGVLVRMGAQVREAIEDVDQIEPRGIVEVTGAPLKGTVIQGKEIPQLIDELPILAVAGALASGTTIIRHAAELRVKETDRIRRDRAQSANHGRAGRGDERWPGNSRAGASEGRARCQFWRPSNCHGFCVAGLFAEGETIVQDAECIRESYPSFEAALEEFVSPKRGRATTPVIGSFSAVRLDGE